MLKRVVLLSLITVLHILTSAAQEIDLSVARAEAEGNKVTFTFTNGGISQLSFLDNKNFKVWVAPDGKLERNNPSFAVVKEVFDPSFKVTLQESTSNYEIFTGAMRVRIQKMPFNIQVFDKYQRPVTSGIESQFLVEGTHITSRQVLYENEAFLGLGEKAGPLNRRGKTYTMWNSDQPCYSENQDPLYKSIPFFMSSRGYGIFLDNTYKTNFDFGKASNDYITYSAPDGPFIYYFFYGKDFKEIIAAYTQLTGKPIMPPEWAFGFSQSRGMLTNENLTREIANEYRKRNIPCDIIYQDIGWVDQLQNFDWRSDRYENPKKMLNDLADQGFKVIVSQDPVISQGNKTQWEEAKAKDFLVKDDRNGKAYDMPWPWGGNAGVVDFTNPKVADWWGELQQKPLDDGVKGFWTDMGEPAWSNQEATDRLHMQHYAGMHSEIHNVYGLTWDKVVTEQFEKHNPSKRVFQMTRAAYSGMQRYTFGWSGDSGNGDDVTAGWSNFANQIPVGLSAGMGLIPFWTTDISGYCGDITDYEAFSELYVRWLQFGIFNPLSRAHHEGNNAVEPWLFGDRAEKIAKKAIELKYKLHPYIYSYARAAYDTGIPIMRAMSLEYPNDKETYALNSQFMYGEELLIAPVVEEGAKNKEIYLPKGEWIDFNEPSHIYDGGKFIEYPVNLETIPIFVKKGAIIPEMPVMQYIGAMEKPPLMFEIFPDESKSAFEVYEDDGETNDYKKEVFSKTSITAQTKEKRTLIAVKREDSENFTKWDNRNYWMIIHKSNPPKGVKIGENKISQYKREKLQENLNQSFQLKGYFYDEKSEELYIRVPQQDSEIQITIQN